MVYLLVAAGLVLLLVGGEFLVRGAVALSRRLGVPPLVIGLTIVAYGTSAPELLVSLEAHLKGSPGIAIGNVVGSNIANLLLILGCAAVIYPITYAPSSVKLNGRVLLGASIMLVVLGLSGEITAWASVPMLALLFGFTFYCYQSERRTHPNDQAQGASAVKEVEDYEDGPRTLAGCVIVLLGGLGGVVVGSHFLVVGAVDLARDMGIDEATIGLTLVAVGTSLPELATAIVAAYRRHTDLVLGNVIGSNIFNTLGVMGVVPLFGSLPIPAPVAAFDLWIMLGVTVFFVAWTGMCRTMGRLGGLVFLIAYGAYVSARLLGYSALPIS